MHTEGAGHFFDEEAAYRFIESHIWPDGVTCAHCNENMRIKKLLGRSTRIGVYKCYNCRKPFTVKSGTIFEGARVPLHTWLQAIYLLSGSLNSVSLTELQQALHVTRKTAWQMSCRIQDAMEVERSSNLIRRTKAQKSTIVDNFSDLLEAMLSEGRIKISEADKNFQAAIARITHLHSEWALPESDQESHY